MLQPEIIDSGWNKKAGVWNVLYSVLVGDLMAGQYDLRIQLADSSGAKIEKRVPVRVL